MAGVPSLMVEKAEREEKSVIELMLSVADKSEQIAREAARQAFIETDKPIYTQPFKEILQGKRFQNEKTYTTEEFRTDVYEKLGIDQPGNVEEDLSAGAKMAADFATDMMFNVDGLLFGLPGKIVGESGKVATKALKGLDITKESKALKALSNVNPVTLGRATTGSVLGASMAQEDDDASDIIKKIGLGTLTGLAFSPTASQAFGKAFKQLDTVTIDGANRAFRPEFYKTQQRLMRDVPLDERSGLSSGTDVGIQDLMRIGARKEKKMLEEAHFYRKELEDIEKGLSEADLQTYDNLRLQAAGMSKKIRNEYYDKTKAAFEKEGKKLRGSKANAALNEASKRANSIVAKKMLPIIQESDASGKVVGAMDDFVKFNKRKIDDYNKTVKDTGNPYLVGFDYYMPNILPDLGGAAQELRRVKGGFKKVDSPVQSDLSGLSRGEIRDLAARNYSKAFMDGQERTARMLIASVNKMPLDMPGGKAISSFLEGIDGLQRNIVAGQLFATHLWMTTNYLDNLGRAYMVTGLGPTLRMAAGGLQGIATSAGRVAVENNIAKGARELFKKVPVVGELTETLAKGLEDLTRSNMIGEIMDATHPKYTGKGKFNNEMLELATVTGVLDTDKAKQFLQHWDQYGGIRTLLNSEERLPPLLRGLDNAIEKNYGRAANIALKTAKKGGQMVNAANKVYTDFLTDTMARIGTANEAYTRVVTFEHVYNSLIKQIPGGKKALKKAGGPVEAFKKGMFRDVTEKASQVVQDTFFDYSNVTAFEKAYAKRMIPFWTYYTRSAHFWIGNLMDPERIGRVMTNIRALKDLGREPTEQDRKYISPYKLKEGARMLPDAPDGRSVVVNFPGASVFDALNDVSGVAAVFGKLTGAWPKGVSAERIKALEKISPILKTGIELTTGKNMMTGEPILPSESPLKRSRVFSDALATKDLLELPPLSLIPYKTKIYVDQKGREYFVEDDTFAQVIVVRRNLFPLRILDSIKGYQQDVDSGKRTKMEAGIHYFTPFSIKTYTPEERIKGVKRDRSRKKRVKTVRSKMRELE
jgi:hypothetical protein